MPKVAGVVLALAGFAACAGVHTAPQSTGAVPSPSAPSPSASRRPEDVFARKIVITREALPLHFSGPSAFTAALEKERAAAVWFRTRAGTEPAWVLPYVAFFAEPLPEREVVVSLFDGERLVASDSQRVREPGSRIFSSEIALFKPEFEPFKNYRMTISAGATALASTDVWLLDVAAGYALHVGRFGSRAAAAGPEDVEVFRDVFEKDLRARWPAATTGPSTAPGILVVGDVVQMSEAATSDGPEISCDVQILVGRWPDRRAMLQLNTGATVQVRVIGTKSGARHDCLEASAHQIADELGPLYGASR